MNTVIVISDVICVVAFSAAAILALVLPFSALVTRSARVAFAFAMFLYAAVSISNVLEHAGITAAFDRYEDLAEILFVPTLAYVATTIYLNFQIAQQQRSARAEKMQNDLLINIVDTVPGGIMVVDPAGGVSFANEGAERILGLSNDEGGALRITPPWVLTDPLTGEATSLAEIASGDAIVRKPLRARWPDGAYKDLSLSATPMTEAGGGIGGSVIAFEEVTVYR